MLGKMKDGALGLALRHFLNERFGEYGDIVDCQVDTAANRLTVTAQLKGEAQPVSATIERYSLEREGKEVYVALQGFSTSREWLTRLLTQLFAGKRYTIPATVAKLL